MCNLYSITRSQDAMRRLFAAARDPTGNLPPLPGVFPDMPALIVRVADGERQLEMMRWGMPAPTQFGGGIIAVLLIAEHKECDLLDIRHRTARCLDDRDASIEPTDNEQLKPQPFDFAVTPAMSCDFESLIADTGEYMNLNFKVSAAFYRRFPYEAAMAEISMKRLIEICFQMYMENQANKTRQTVRPSESE